MTTTPHEVDLIERSASALASPRQWFGMSGHLVTGECVALHVEAAARLMERENWDPQMYAPFSGRHIRDALESARLDGAGDADTQYVARTVMEALLRTYTGAPYVDYEVWSEHSSRTLAEVLTLLRTTAEAARRHGPALARPVPPLTPGGGI
ncbi:hypothetical protein [Streptomyces sp. NPDC002215]|uniref:DUF6197 family protein n=1 Tax=Streptomyces sp. NPDC002215 TaxID=3154412 RepID=UPI0033216621